MGLGGPFANRGERTDLIGFRQFARAILMLLVSCFAWECQLELDIERAL